MVPTRIKCILRAATVAALAWAASAGAQAQITGSRTSSFTYQANGLLKSETIEPNNAQLCVTTNYSYDTYGNKIGAATSNCVGAVGLAKFDDRYVSTAFAAQAVSVAGVSNVAVPAGAFATASKVALTANIADADSQGETREYDPRFGIATSLTGPNGLKTTWALDDFGRKTLETRADGTKTAVYYCLLKVYNGTSNTLEAATSLNASSNSPGCHNTSAPAIPVPAPSEQLDAAFRMEHSVALSAANAQMAAFSRVYYDAAGRKLRTVTQAFALPGAAARLIVQDTEYNAYGAQVVQTQPYFLDTRSSLAAGTATFGITYTELDVLGRPSAVYTTDPSTATGTSQFGQTGGSSSFTFTSAYVYGPQPARQAAKTTITYSGLNTLTKDDKGRTRLEEKNPDGKVVRVTDAQGYSAQGTDGAQVVHQHDAFGNLIQTKDALGYIVTISWDVRGRKVQMNDPDAGVVTYCYDALGQLKAQQTSAMRGSHATTVACPSNAGSGTTAPTVSGWTTLAHDRLGRLVHRVEPEYATNWYFDKYAGGAACNKGIGKLCETRTSHGVNRKTLYDSLGRPTESRTDVSAGPSLGTAVSYTAEGRVATQTYPTGVKLKYVYTTETGYLSQVLLASKVTVNPLPANAGGSPAASRVLQVDTVLWQMQSANAWGKAELKTLGDGSYAVNNRAAFDPQTGRLLNLTAGKGSASDVVDHRYTWDSINLLSKRIDALGGGPSNIAVLDVFDHDSLGRLTQYTVSGGSTNSPSSRTVALQYNAAGMLLYKSDVGVYSYPAQGVVSGKPHALQSVVGTVNASFTYDLNGNLITSTGGKYRTVEYTSFNLPTGNTSSGGIGGPGGTPRYAWMYDESHARIKETRINSAGTRVTWNLHPDNQGGLGFEREEAPNGVASNRHYISAGGGAVAVLVTVGALPSLPAGTLAPPALPNNEITARKLEYWHKDHLGSLIATTDHLGAVTASYAYDPFGKRRFTNGSYDAFGTVVVDWSTEVAAGTDRGYTGHEHLDDVGLIHMNGRVFDPTLGRFMQPDPFIQDPGNLQNFDRFGYCYNNPLTCTDPTGYCFLGCFWQPVRAISILTRLAYEISPLKMVGVSYGDYRLVASIAFAVVSGVPPGIFEAAVSGFVSGAIATGTTKGAIQGAFTAGAFYGVGNVIQGGDFFAGGGTSTNYSAVGGKIGAVALHGVVGCVSSVTGGGKCGSGLLSAAFSELATVNGLKADGPAGVISAAIIGGTASALGGGKFANGASTAAMGYLFNELLHQGPGTARERLARSGYVGAADEGVGDVIWKTNYPNTIPVDGAAGETLQCTARCVGRDLYATGGQEQWRDGIVGGDLLHSPNSAHYENQAVDFRGLSVQSSKVLSCSANCGFRAGWWENWGQPHWHFQLNPSPSGRPPTITTDPLVKR